MPEGWTKADTAKGQDCVSINGSYHTRGLGKTKGGDTLTESRLDVALGHAFPQKKMPDLIEILVNDEEGTLSYRLGSPINQDFSVSTNCQNGWYKSEKRHSDMYIGEGGTLDYSVRNIELAKSIEGDLIIHLMLEAQSTSFFIFKAHDMRESWSKYKLAGDPD